MFPQAFRGYGPLQEGRGSACKAEATANSELGYIAVVAALHAASGLLQRGPAILYAQPCTARRHVRHNRGDGGSVRTKAAPHGGRSHAVRHTCPPARRWRLAWTLIGLLLVSGAWRAAGAALSITDAAVHFLASAQNSSSGTWSAGTERERSDSRVAIAALRSEAGASASLAQLRGAGAMLLRLVAEPQTTLDMVLELECNSASTGALPTS